MPPPHTSTTSFGDEGTGTKAQATKSTQLERPSSSSMITTSSGEEGVNEDSAEKPIVVDHPPPIMPPQKKQNRLAEASPTSRGLSAAAGPAPVDTCETRDESWNRLLREGNVSAKSPPPMGPDAATPPDRANPQPAPPPSPPPAAIDWCKVDIRKCPVEYVPLGTPCRIYSSEGGGGWYMVRATHTITPDDWKPIDNADWDVADVVDANTSEARSTGRSSSASRSAAVPSSPAPQQPSSSDNDDEGDAKAPWQVVGEGSS